jgi:NADH-ubiquinone oxidoreductase chain 3
MSSMTLFILFVSIIALLFLFINLVFAPHNPYQEKDSMFECGFHSFQQSRSPFNIAFFIYALVYLLLDLEILLTFPFAVSEYVNNIYGLIITLGFITIITIGFVYELGKGALKIPSKQYTYTIKNQPLIHISYIKTKSAEITKPHPFITSTLQSSISPFTMSMQKN